MLVFLDVETTGFDPSSSDLLELSAVRWDGAKIVAEFDELIAPQNENFEIPPVVRRLTGITEEMAQGGKSLHVVREKFLQQFLQKDDVIVGHNISFDTGFLRENGFEFGNDEIDTYPLSTIISPGEGSYSLEVLTEKYNLPHEAAHRAMGDVLGNLELWKFLQQRYSARFSNPLREKCQSLLQKTSWTGRYFFERLPEGQEVVHRESFPEKPSVFDTPRGSEEEGLIDEIISLFQEKKSAVWEVFFSYPANPFLFSVEAAKRFCASSQKTVYICYSPERESVVSELVARESGGSSVVFFSKYCPPSLFLDLKKWQSFISKAHFSDNEITVALKVARDMEKGKLSAPNFYREEWSVWKQLSQDFCHSVSEQEESGVIFVPERYLSDIEGEYLLLDGAEDLEDILTLFSTKRGSSSSVRELVSNASSKLEEGILFFFDLFCSFCRETGGESLYSLDIPHVASLYTHRQWGDFLKRIQQLSVEAKDELGDDHPLCKELGLWAKFLSSGNKKNVLAFFRLFPNNEVEWRESPVLLSDSFEDLSQRFSSLVCIGSHFPKKENGEWVFPFAFSSDVLQDVKSVSSDNIGANIVSFSDLPAGSNTPRGLLGYLKNIIASSLGNVLVHLSSQKNAEVLEELLFEMFPVASFDILSHRKGNLGKVLHFLQKPGRKIFLATPPLLKKLQGSFSKISPFETLVFQKFIFDPPQKTLFSARKKLFTNEFLDFVLPRSIGRFEAAFFRLDEMQREPFFFYCCDSRITDINGFGQGFFKILPEQVDVRKVSREEISDIYT